MNDTGQIFVERVRRRLKELDRTTDWLAEQLGIGGSGIRKVLSENRAPRIDTLLRWADALNVEVAWLLGREIVVAPPSRELEILKLRVIHAALACDDDVALDSALRAIQGSAAGSAGTVKKAKPSTG